VFIQRGALEVAAHCFRQGFSDLVILLRLEIAEFFLQMVLVRCLDPVAFDRGGSFHEAAAPRPVVSPRHYRAPDFLWWVVLRNLRRFFHYHCYVRDFDGDATLPGRVVD